MNDDDAKFRLTVRHSFTLMEVMVATMILGLITVVIYASFARTLEIPQILRAVHEDYHRIRVAMNRISREVSMAYLSKHVNPNQDEGWRYIFRIKKENPGVRLDFTSLAHLRMYEDTPESDESEIGYFLMADPKNRDQTNLVRREQNHIDHEPGWGGEIEVLCENVVEFEVKAWKDEEEDWADEWDTTQIEQLDKLPKILSISLTTQDGEGKKTVYYTKTQIMMNAPLDLNKL